MAEGVISSLLLKIGATLACEATTFVRSLLKDLRPLFRDIRDIKDELEGMQSFLQQKERFKCRDETASNFVKQIGNLAFEIEDVIDEFNYKLGEEPEGIVWKTIKRIRNIRSWHELSSQLKQIKESLHNATQRRMRYDTRASEQEARPRVAEVNKRMAESAHFTKEDDLVGIEESKNKFIGWLKDEEQQRTIISVWGMGGVGKTTLVTQAYNSIKATFDSCAWVSVSQNYNADDLLRQIIKEFCRDDREDQKKAISGDIDAMDYRSLVETIHNFLQNKRYVVILDDVWSVNVWNDIKDAFLVGKSSRIVLTTRISEVAKLASRHQIFELKPLQEDHARELFCRRAFSKCENTNCPPGLTTWVDKFVKKCDGLPIAIVSIGSLLSFKKPTDSEWEKVFEDLDWQLNNNTQLDRVNGILNVSFENLPHYLKNCFLYCSIFPEDYGIYRKRLIRLWVGEGFIEERNRRTLEEVAQDYLDELIDRSLLQVVERNEVGRVRACRMHDIIRLLAISKAKDESFCMVYDSSTAFTGVKARRLSMQSGNFPEIREDTMRLRSFVVFDSSMGLDLLKLFLTSSKLIRVLDLHGVRIKELPDEVFNLFNLHFLGLRKTRIEKLPKSIGRLKKLQILDVFGTNIEKMPMEIIKLKMLRHLFVFKWHGKPFSRLAAVGGVPSPQGVWKWKYLQTLQSFEASTEMVQNLGALTELRTFGITKVTSSQCADLFISISKMNHLVHLEVFAKDEEEVLSLGTLCLPPPIRKVLLYGKLEKESWVQCFMSFASLEKLTILRLYWSRIETDPLPYLQVLSSLRKLQLWQAYDGTRLCFREASFPKLSSLSIWGAPQLSELEIEQRAIAHLSELVLGDCPQLKVLPQGIEHLTTLRFEIEQRAITMRRH